MNYIIRRIFIQRMKTYDTTYHFIFIYAAEAYDHELFLCEKEFSFVHFFLDFVAFLARFHYRSLH